jgi:cation transport ATPase
MTHSYTIQGITCSSCVSTIKNKLFLHPEITAIDISADGMATISMLKHLNVKELQTAVGNDSNYIISEDSSDRMQHQATGEESKSWFSTYKPLLLIAVYITGVSVLFSNGSFHVGMTYFMAGFFLVFSFFKFLDLKGFASSYAMYDLLAMKVPAYGFIYPFIELFLGLAYATGFKHLFTNWATLIVMGFSAIGVIRSVLNKQKIQCACLGAVFNLPMSVVTIIEDLLMVAMAIYMLADL